MNFKFKTTVITNDSLEQCHFMLKLFKFHVAISKVNRIFRQFFYVVQFCVHVNLKSYNFLLQISDLRQRLSPMTVWSNPTSRSNSSNSMSPSAKSSASSADSFMSFPRLTPKLGPKSGTNSSTTKPTKNSISRPSSPLPKILPKLPECVVDYDQIIGGSLTQFMRFSSKKLL